MAKMKKAIFFTTTSILIVSFILSVYAYQTYISQKYEMEAVKARVDIANNYAKDLEDTYLPRIIRVASYRALNTLTEYVKGGGVIVSEKDLKDLFIELLLEGEIDNVAQPTMGGYYLLEKLRDIESETYDALRIKVSFTTSYFDGMLLAKAYNELEEKVKIYQSSFTGPWDVGVNLTINYTIDTISAFWNKSVTIETKFNFEELNDPLLAVREDYENVIRQVNNTAWNITGFYYHTNSMTYAHNKNAPGYLQRFYDDFSASECCGIETMINTNKINAGDQMKVYVDWCFYSSRCAEGAATTDLYYVNCIRTTFVAPGYFPSFKLDPSHGALYNITSYLYPLTEIGTCTEAPWPP